MSLSAMMPRRSILMCRALALFLAIPALASTTIPPAAQTLPAEGPTRAAPEAASGRHSRGVAVARHHMVAAANPYASEAGREILRAGGSAVDAAVAVQLVLNLVEPQSSGIGGGAFLLHFDAATRSLKTYDGRET